MTKRKQGSVPALEEGEVSTAEEFGTTEVSLSPNENLEKQPSVEETDLTSEKQELDDLKMQLGVANTEIERLNKAYREVQKSLSAKDITIKQSKATPYPDGFVEKANRLWDYTDGKGLKDSQLDVIAKRLQGGDLDGATRKLNEFTDASKAKEIEDKAEVLMEARARKLGLLQADSLMPMGRAGRGFQETEDAFARGEVSLETYEAERAKQNID